MPTNLPDRFVLDRARRKERTVAVAQAVVATVALLLVVWNLLAFDPRTAPQPYRANPYPDGPFGMSKKLNP